MKIWWDFGLHGTQLTVKCPVARSNPPGMRYLEEPYLFCQEMSLTYLLGTRKTILIGSVRLSPFIRNMGVRFETDSTNERDKMTNEFENGSRFYPHFQYAYVLSFIYSIWETHVMLYVLKLYEEVYVSLNTFKCFKAICFMKCICFELYTLFDEVWV